MFFISAAPQSSMERMAKVPSPCQLKYYSNPDSGLIQLSWNMESEPIMQLVGFIIEYRTKRDQNVESSESLRDSIRQKRSAEENDDGDGGGAEWRRLIVIPSNVTSFIIQSYLPVYRDISYEFRVYAVTSFSFSEPSSSVNINTSGRCFVRFVFHRPYKRWSINGTG